MIAIFTTENDAIAYSNKVHEYLSANRPSYSASKWQDPVKSADNLSWLIQCPDEEIINKCPQPINTSVEISKAEITVSLPEIGQQCLINKYYQYKGDIVKCRQTHNRTIYEPKDTPALFSFFRDNTDSLKWIEGEQVQIGWMRIYNGIKYEVIQAHQTQSDWTPDKATTLWKVYVDTSILAEWKTGISYKVNDIVIYKGNSYKCRQAHTSISTWQPDVVPALWLKI